MFPDYETTAQDGGKVVSLTHRLLFTPRKYSWYSFLLEAESSPGPQEIMSMKNPNDTSWNRTSDLPIFAVTLINLKRKWWSKSVNRNDSSLKDVAVICSWHYHYFLRMAISGSFSECKPCRGRGMNQDYPNESSECWPQHLRQLIR